MRINYAKMKNHQGGFTILELMIATLVFSAILLLCATAIAQVGKIFYKGVTVNKVQQTARTISDDITQSIQFAGVSGDTGFVTNGTDIETGAKYICVGEVRYTYYKNKIKNDDNKYVLWKDTPSDCGEAADMRRDPPSANGRELLGKGMRAPLISVSTTSPYIVKVTISYGEDDLFTDNTFSQCVPKDKGGQFCGTSTITTKVIKRL